MKTSHRRKHRLRCCDRGQASPHPQRRHSRHRRGSRLSKRTTHHEHVSEAALVGVARTRPNERRNVAWSDQVQLQRRSDCFVWRADRRDDGGSVSQPAKHMRGPWRGERNDCIRTSDGASLRTPDVRIRPRRNVHRNHRQSGSVDGRDRFSVKSAHGRTKSRAQDRIDQQLLLVQ